MFEEKNTPMARVREARMHLMRLPEFALLGYLGLRMDLVESTAVQTACCNGKRIMFSPGFVETLSHNQLVRMVAHEIAHPALGHTFRRRGRCPDMWNDAADLAVHCLIKSVGDDIGIEWTPEKCNMPDGLTADEYYKLLNEKRVEQLQKQLQEMGDAGESGEDEGDAAGSGGSGESGEDDGENEAAGGGSGGDGDAEGESAGGGSPEGQEGGQERRMEPRALGNDVEDAPGDEYEGEDLEREWQAAVVETATQMEQAGNGSSLGRTVVDLAAPATVSWRQTLRRFCTDVARTKPSFRRPNRRHVWSGTVLPSRSRGKELRRVALGMDVSGSVCDAEVKQMLGELSGILMAFPQAEVTLVPWDTQVRTEQVESFKRHDLPFRDVELIGRGGTRVCRFLEWLEESKDTQKPYRAAIIFTDGWIYDYPTDEDGFPECPVLWLMTKKSYRPPPFGEVVVMGE